MSFLPSLRRTLFAPVRRRFSSNFAPAPYTGKLETRYSFSLSTWFCVPERGMTNFEILIRSSAFVAKSHSPQYKGGYHVVSTSHNVCPWRYPKYYPYDWLKFVNETHVFYTLEVRFPDGSFCTQMDLLCESFHHRTRDLAALHFEADVESLTVASDLGFKILDLDTLPVSSTDDLLFCGHKVEGPAVYNDDPNDNRLAIPAHIAGNLIHRTEHQTFARTDELLVEGMCGGPVISERDRICGMVEGIVPMEHPDNTIRGAASIIEAQEIRRFLNDVENDSIKALTGGHSAKHLADNADPEIAKDPFNHLTKKI